MKKREMKKRIVDGFSELAPEMFEAVVEAVEEQKLALSETEMEEPMLQAVRGIPPFGQKADTKDDMERKSFWFGKDITKGFARYALSMCAGLALICLFIFHVPGKSQDVVYMVLDINPSIQVEMNQAHQVERLRGLNQDGKDVVKELKWKRKESVQELLDVLIQDVVEKSYLRDHGGILVTLSASDKGMCEKLEYTLGAGIDRKLTELKVSGVMTAFQQAERKSGKEGRKLLEAELEQTCGLKQEQVEQMSVMELIQYCQDNTSVELKLSEVSAKEREAQSKKEEVKSHKAQKQPEKENSQLLSEEEDGKPKDGGLPAGEESKTGTDEEKQHEEMDIDLKEPKEEEPKDEEPKDEEPKEEGEVENTNLKDEGQNPEVSPQDNSQGAESADISGVPIIPQKPETDGVPTQNTEIPSGQSQGGNSTQNSNTPQQPDLGGALPDNSGTSSNKNTVSQDDGQSLGETLSGQGAGEIGVPIQPEVPKPLEPEKNLP